ncbi:MAG: hypothetical protein H7Y04_02275 [Verrucomicrobia bacterium]|nr:hypothetical protein [Cytophagales bacterium]
MDAHTLVLLGVGIFVVWLIFKFIKALFRMALFVFVVILALWFYPPTRSWVKSKLGLSSSQAYTITSPNIIL